MSGKPEILNQAQALVGERDMALFEAAISSMPCAFNLWDEKFNLVLFNQRYLDIYGLPKSLVKKGLPLRDLIEYRLESGSIPGANLDDVYEAAKADFYGDMDVNHPVHLEKVLDGRTIRIGVMYHAGVGWVVTHEDISETANRLKKIKLRETELQLQNNRFDAAVGNMAHGLAMFDADEKLVICNNAYLDMYRLSHGFGRPGTPYEDIIKHRATLAKSSVVTDTNETPVSVIEHVKNLKPDDAPYKRTWEFEDGQHVSIMYDSTGDGGWVSTHEDVTIERQRAKAIKKREADLQLQYSRFDAAVDNMAHGLAMFDGTKKLVVCNQEYADLYSLPQNLSVPGTAFDDIVACRQKNGMLHKDGLRAHHERFEKAMGEKTPQMEDFEMANGKTISILHRAMVGGGWISTHVDVTEERQKTRALELREAELKQQNNRFDAAVDNMAHGLAMFDRDGKLVICNDAYLEMYHLPKSFAKPGVAQLELVAYRESLDNIGLVDDQHGTPSETIEIARKLQPGETPIKRTWEFKDGKHISVMYGSTGDGGWVSTHENVTQERMRVKAAKIREAELRLQNSRFDAAVGNMAHGLAMYDADQNLVICNRRYSELYLLPDDLSQPGTSFHAIVTWIRNSGYAPKGGIEIATDLIVKSIKAGVSQVVDYEMNNGKTYTIIDELTDEGGWVSLHEDVTEERERISALRLREGELKLQNNRFNAAVDNMAHGLAMFDAEEKLVICNDPYLEIYNLPKEFGKSGVLFKDIMDYRETVGTTPKTANKEELNAIVHGFSADINQGDKPTIKVWEMANGQHVSVSYGPLNDGGWVSTHEDVTERRNKELEIRHLARHDALTNLPNRTFFAEYIEKAESRIVRGEQMAILCLDLDHFKEINDSLGHGVGDEVLKQVAARLKSAVRDHEIVARMGGDEFVILVGPIDKPEQASLVAQRILNEFETPMSVEGHRIRVGASLGIAVSPSDGNDGAALMKNADRALYRSKDEGRGGFRFFEKGMDADIHFRRNMEHDLKRALDKGQFYLTYAPTLELESNRISSCEAIINWNHPKLGSLLSDDFVQIAQETGMNNKLIGWVIEEALVQANTWPAQVRLTINLSTVQFGQNNLVSFIKNAIEKTNFDPARLEVGISEVHLVKNTAQTVKILKEIRALGVLIGMDEFGKENSSLNNLRLFSFDKINLDSSFVSDVSGSQENREIAKAIVGLGQSLGITMNAHGVNKECQLDFMRKLGCQEVQGHLFSAALPQHSIRELLRTVELRAADKAGIKLSDAPLDRVMDL